MEAVRSFETLIYVSPHGVITQKPYVEIRVRNVRKLLEIQIEQMHVLERLL